MLREVTRQVPPGWKAIRAYQSMIHPRDGLVICQRDPSQDQDCEFVVWSVNTIEGGCHRGSYCDTKDEALDEFLRRLGGMS